MVDNDGVWMLQQPGQLHGDLRETEAAATEDLEKVPELGDAFKDPEDNVRNVAQDNQRGFGAAGMVGLRDRGVASWLTWRK